MIVGLQEFPDVLEIHSRIQVRVDPSRLLLTTVQPMKEEGFISLAHSFGLVPEEDTTSLTALTPGVLAPVGRNSSYKPAEKINSTRHHTWVRSPDGQSAISQLTLTSLVDSLGTTLARISPVYQYPRVAGRRGLLCPLPHVLLIKPTTPCNNGEDPSFAHNFDKKLLTRYELEHIPARTKYSGEYRYYLLKRGSIKTVYQTQQLLLSDKAKLVKEAQFEIMPLLSASAWPNDPKFLPATGGMGQWNLVRIHAAPHPSSVTNRPPVWQSPSLISRFAYPANEVVVWLVDDGCDTTHSDLQLYDQGTYFSLMDLNLGNTAFQRISTMQDIDKPAGSHGTMCAGIIAPVSNNGEGVAGIASKTCKVFPLAGEASTDALRAAAVYYAAHQTALGAGGVLAKTNVYAKVISWSEGDDSWNPSIIDPAIQAAVDQGIVICVATQDQGVSITYPATNPNVIACGSCDDKDTRYLSNFGNNLSVVAPGFNIWTTLSGGDYIQFPATSAATPHVAALAALLLSVQPNLTVQSVRAIIEGTAEKISPQQSPYTYSTFKTDGTPTNNTFTWNEQVGYGLINVAAAMDQVLQRMEVRLEDRSPHPAPNKVKPSYFIRHRRKAPKKVKRGHFT